MAGMDGLLCTEVPLDADDEWRMLDGFISGDAGDALY